jgi:hypothetical protein
MLMPTLSVRARHALVAGACLALLLAVSPAQAREIADPPNDFRIDVPEHGPACVLVPAAQYDETACAPITTTRPETLAAATGSPTVQLVGAVAVGAGGWTYTVDVLREARATTPVVSAADAEGIATGFVDKMQPALSMSGATAKRAGPAELSTIDGVQALTFAVRAEGSAHAAVDCTVFSLVIAQGFTYTLEVRGPSSHADDLGQITRASLSTLHATPLQPSRVYAIGVTAARVAGLVFLGALVATFTVILRRRRRG